jgi:hypothetical protein
MLQSQNKYEEGQKRRPSHMRKNSHAAFMSAKNDVERVPRISLKMPIIEKNVNRNLENNKENTSLSRNSKNSIQVKRRALKGVTIDSTLRNLFTTIQTKLNSSKTISSVVFEAVDDTLAGDHQKYCRYLSLADLCSLNQSPNTTRDQIFEQKQRANRCMGSMIASIGH